MKTIAFDFDGVLHSYTTPPSQYPDGVFNARYIPDPPVKAGMKTLYTVILHGDMEAVIFSTRCGSLDGIHAMEKWLTDAHRAYVRELGEERSSRLWNMDILEELRFVKEKPPAWLTIDDRAVQFQGAPLSAADILNFRPWNKRGGPGAPITGKDEDTLGAVIIERDKASNEVAHLKRMLARESDQVRELSAANSEIIRRHKHLQAATQPVEPGREPSLRSVIAVQTDDIGRQKREITVLNEHLQDCRKALEDAGIEVPERSVDDDPLIGSAIMQESLVAIGEEDEHGSTDAEGSPAGESVSEDAGDSDEGHIAP